MNEPISEVTSVRLTLSERDLASLYARLATSMCSRGIVPLSVTGFDPNRHTTVVVIVAGDKLQYTIAGEEK